MVTICTLMVLVTFGEAPALSPGGQNAAHMDSRLPSFRFWLDLWRPLLEGSLIRLLDVAFSLQYFRIILPFPFSLEVTFQLLSSLLIPVFSVTPLPSTTKRSPPRSAPLKLDYVDGQ